MKLLLDSLWRAAAYCILPRVIGLSLFPLLLLAAVGGSLGYFFWSDAVEYIRQWLENTGFTSTVLDWFTRFGLQSFRAAVAPIILIALATPVLILLVMWVIALLMTPALIQLVSKRRFTALAQQGQSRLLNFAKSAAWSIASTLVAGVLLVVSVPLWFIPPLIMILPPLIWGWLTYRVMSFDALSNHASNEERRLIMKAHKKYLLIIGIVAGFLGAMPSLIWALGAMAAVFAVILLPVMLWLYTLIFAFSSLWFIHYCLAALEQHRANEAAKTVIPMQAQIHTDPLKEITHA